MNRKTLISILKQIVVDCAFHKELQINTFVVMNKPLDLLHTSFGATFDDYTDGNFFSRAWVNSGANRNDVRAEFPMIGVEQRKVTQRKIGSKTKFYEAYLMIADKLGCDGCIALRTPEQVQGNTSIMLSAFLTELSNYAEFSYMTTGQPEKKMWASDGRMAYLLSEGQILSYSELNRFQDFISDNQLEINELRLMDGYFGCGVKLTVRGCDSTDEVHFNYQNTPLSTIAQTYCDSCN